MYERRSPFETPPDDLSLWRYMDTGRFLALLSNKALYLSRKLDLDDPWEGVVPPLGVKRAVRELYETEANARFVEESVRETAEAAAARAVISCWHKNDRESVAMWRLYTSGAEGVAIQTTISRLKTVFEQEPCSVTISEVRYIDHLSEDLGRAWALDPLSPLFCKRRGFEHEREVRCVIAHPQGEREQALWWSELRPDLQQRFPVLEQWAAVVDGDLGDGGLAVPVDLVALIERIIVSPRYPAWAIPALQTVVDKAGVAVCVETSSLLEQPQPLGATRVSQRFETCQTLCLQAFLQRCKTHLCETLHGLGRLHDEKHATRRFDRGGGVGATPHTLANFRAEHSPKKFLSALFPIAYPSHSHIPTPPPPTLQSDDGSPPGQAIVESWCILARLKSGHAAS